MKDQKEVKRGYAGLESGEVLGFGQKSDGASTKYCTKRCACIVWWQVFVIMLLVVAGVAAQIVLIRADVFDPSPPSGVPEAVEEV